MRDYLAANAEAASAYVQRKRDILARSGADPATYAQLKLPLLAQLLDDAERWKAAAATALPGS